jgi:diadenylate cyclase
MEFETLTNIIRWQDVVDILLNSYILFRLYVLFRGTRVIRVVAGLVLLWVFQRVAVQMELIVTSWAMQGIIAVAALIIIIVFRNEISEVLQARNWRAILWGFPRRITGTPIEIITESIHELSRRRIGALIVLPGKENISELVTGGIEWQGVVSREMLLSIFWRGNPVHDGAIIVEGRRIARVGAILPLSQRNDLPQRFGTRHRAAVGLAQESDALVIVVSEETGGVTVTRGEDIIDIRDNHMLIRELRRHLGMEKKKAEGIKRETLELSTVAVLCIMCITAIWFSFSKGMQTLTTIKVPVEFTNRAGDLNIFDTSASTVDLYLSGSGTLIKSLQPSQLKAFIDLKNANIGENTFNLNGRNVMLPPGVTLNRIEPASLRVTLDRTSSKKVPIQVSWTGSLPEGLILENAVIVPSQIRVTGASRLLEKTDTIYTEPVPLDKLTESGRLDVRLNPGAASLQVAQERVEVRYTIGKRVPVP